MTLPLRTLSLIFLAGAIVACDCYEIPLEEDLAHTDSVFVARIIGAQYPEQHWTVVNGDSFPEESNDQLVVAWRAVASRGWKAQVPDTVTIYSERSESSCGYMFRIGREYLVYATLMYPKRGYYQGRPWPEGVKAPAATTYFCSRTAQLAVSNVKELGKPDWVLTRKRIDLH